MKNKFLIFFTFCSSIYLFTYADESHKSSQCNVNFLAAKSRLNTFNGDIKSVIAHLLLDVKITPEFKIINAFNLLRSDFFISRHFKNSKVELLKLKENWDAHVDTAETIIENITSLYAQNREILSRANIPDMSGPINQMFNETTLSKRDDDIDFKSAFISEVLEYFVYLQGLKHEFEGTKATVLALGQNWNDFARSVETMKENVASFLKANPNIKNVTEVPIPSVSKGIEPFFKSLEQNADYDAISAALLGDLQAYLDFLKNSRVKSTPKKTVVSSQSKKIKPVTDLWKEYLQKIKEQCPLGFVKKEKQESFQQLWDECFNELIKGSIEPYKEHYELIGFSGNIAA